MERKRGFEIAKGFEEAEINLPVRKTKFSAGYDIEAAEDVSIPSFKKGMKPTLVKTGLKAYMAEDEVLILANRSSNPGKKGLILANSIGVIDSDYYGNPDNDGHIMFAFFNIKDEDIQIKKGYAIGQAIFQKFLTVDNDMAEGTRIGGFRFNHQNLVLELCKIRKKSFDFIGKIWYNKKGLRRPTKE